MISDYFALVLEEEEAKEGRGRIDNRREIINIEGDKGEAQ